MKPVEVARARQAVLGQALKFANEIHDGSSGASSNGNNKVQQGLANDARRRRKLGGNNGAADRREESPDAVDAFHEIGKV